MGLLNSVAAQGRNGDTRLAHVTPGEVVIPKEVAAMRPDLVAHVSAQLRKMGGDPSSLTVGRGVVNPNTGIEEFATAADVSKAYADTFGASRVVSDADQAYWQGQDLGTFAKAAAPEVASGINAAYKSNFGRDADAAGASYWNDQVSSGKIGTTAALNTAIRAGAQGADIAALGTVKTAAATPTPPPATVTAPINPYVATTAVAAPVAPVATYAPTTQTFNEGMSTQGRLSGLLANESTYMQSARTKALQQGAAKGLLNSSLTATAGEQAAINSALPIAQQDSSAYNAMSTANQNAANTAGQFNAGATNAQNQFVAGQTNQTSQFNAGAANTAAQFSANWQNDFLKLQQQQTNALQSAGYSAELQGSLQTQLNAFNASQSQLARDATAANMALAQANTVTNAATNQANTATNMNTSEGQGIVTALSALSTKLTADINNISATTGIDAAAKANMINNAIVGAKASQETLKSRAAVIKFDPGTYFNFDTLKPNSTGTAPNFSDAEQSAAEGKVSSAPGLLGATSSTSSASAASPGQTPGVTPTSVTLSAGTTYDLGNAANGLVGLYDKAGVLKYAVPGYAIAKGVAAVINYINNFTPGESNQFDSGSHSSDSVANNYQTNYSQGPGSSDGGYSGASY